ncbi:4-phosphoerythronate dehydrogenase PdxB [Larsenimonas rhizosphaerae]|uniref:Erythronate-4-phosphate dehydrogenase n=1 Tax=Larsenimonas rhizosphaerae TaxID=2944682 RepID=A0AA41ZML2_9GAMM|nr:4-phosphoerythronate dehydrogenase PdxB [Larsenimonas rhizosphaerae]MCX2524638.1 4-phosphoerythronate dehydrogenase PdxB [Larsenimonas rhizosphaerae]
MHIVADRNMPQVEAFFGDHGRVTRVDGRRLSREQLTDADVLLVRSVTRVDSALLQDTPVRFVGTATIGTDHLDLSWLEQAGIPVASAPGCNAESVVDYVLSCLMLACQRSGETLTDRTVGVMGAGQVGSRLVTRLRAMGVTCLVCDPPRAERESAGDFISLAALIEQADVICCHTPLVREGRYPTHHLLDQDLIGSLAPGTWLLNAGRGDCIDTAALKARLLAHNDLVVMLDVWEQEPDIDPELARLVDIATPHIAGYSQEGRLRGTAMLYEAWCHAAGNVPSRRWSDVISAPVVSGITLDAVEGQQQLWEALVLCHYDVRRDMDLVSRYWQQYGISAGFDRYRREYPARREFSSVNVTAPAGWRSAIEALGFVCHARTNG